MSKIVDKLIAQARRSTENEEVSSTIGIKDIEFLQYLNDAQERLQSVVEAVHPSAFIKEKILEATANSEKYKLPVDAYKDNAISTVEYSASGNEDDYYQLDSTYLKNRDTAVSGYPLLYIRRSGHILLQPKPQSAGSIRLNYVKRLNRLDKRRGQISVAVLNNSAKTITTLEINTGTSNPVFDASFLNEDSYICIVDRDGKMLMANIPIDYVNPATGVVTISSGFTFEDGETIPVGSYVVSGQDASTHSELPRMCERYLLAYVSWKILKRDSSVDYAEQQQELQAMEEDIIASFADIDDDIKFVPILNDWNEWD